MYSYPKLVLDHDNLEGIANRRGAQSLCRECTLKSTLEFCLRDGEELMLLAVVIMEMS